jgi:hypothetical protein
MKVDYGWEGPYQGAMVETEMESWKSAFRHQRRRLTIDYTNCSETTEARLKNGRPSPMR